MFVCLPVPPFPALDRGGSFRIFCRNTFPPFVGHSRSDACFTFTFTLGNLYRVFSKVRVFSKSVRDFAVECASFPSHPGLKAPILHAYSSDKQRLIFVEIGTGGDQTQRGSKQTFSLCVSTKKYFVHDVYHNENCCVSHITQKFLCVAMTF